MLPEDQQDRIDAYLTGRLPDPAAFERELAADPALRAETEATRRALDAIDLGGDDQLKERLRGLEARRGGARVRRPRWLTYAAAAALLLFVAGYFFLRPGRDNAQVLALDTVTPYENIAYSVTKGAAAEPRGEAYAAYESGDYAGAARAFTALPAEDPVDRFYLGQSLLATGDYTAAADLFAELTLVAGFRLAPEAEYYQAAAELGTGRLVDARALLSRIADTPGHPMQAEAADLLTKL